MDKIMAAGEFKQRCLRVLDEVEAGGAVIITKRGRPVARLVPIERPESSEKAALARLRGAGGRMLVSERELLRPLTDEAGWDLEDEE